MINKDLVIIGGGSAGLAAAISAYENGISDILIIERDGYLGGILNQCIHNGFGLTKFKEELTGPEYAQRYIDKIDEYKITYKLSSQVVKISSKKVVTYINEKDGITDINAKAIIFATGSYERGAGAVALPGSRVSGIMTAGTAQKYLNIKGYLVGKRVVILGSGNIGLIMARRLTFEGAKVLCVAEIMPYSNGLNRNIVQCLNDFNIPLLLSTTVKQVVGKKRVEKIILAKVDENRQFIPGSEIEYDADCLVISVGLIPYTTLFDDLPVHYGKNRGLVIDNNFQTEIEGIFTCGNCLHIHDLVDYVSNEGEIAGKSAAEYIKGLSKNNSDLIDVTTGNLVTYVIPNKIDRNASNVNFKFRVLKPIDNAYVCITADNKIIKKFKKLSLLPSVMENITVSISDFKDAKEIRVGIINE